MTARTVRRLGTTGALTITAAALLLVAAPAAHAHVSVTTDHAAAGSSAVLTFSVPHGCGDSPTTALAIQIPEEITSVTPTVNPSWSVATTQEDLDEPQTDSHGNDVDARIAEVTYTAHDPLPPELRDTVELSVALPDDAAGTTLYFPTLQRCQEGEAAWVQIAAEGQDPHDLERPAPAVTVAAPDSEQGAGEDSASAAPADPASTGASGAPSADAGRPGLTLAALIVGSLGLLTGLAALFVRRRPSA